MPSSPFVLNPGFYAHHPRNRSGFRFGHVFQKIRAGLPVDFGDLGAFRLQINSGGAPSADLFTSDYIKGVNIQFVPGEELQVIFQGLKFNLVPTRAAQAAVIKAQKAGKTTVDISGKNGSSDSESPDEI